MIWGIQRAGSPLFSKISLSLQAERLEREIQEDVSRLSPAEVRELELEDFAEQVLEEYGLTPLEIDLEQLVREEEREALVTIEDFGARRNVRATRIAISASYSGTASLWDTFADMKLSVPPYGEVAGRRLRFYYLVPEHPDIDAATQSVLQMLVRDKQDIGKYLASINPAVRQLNERLGAIAIRELTKRQAALQSGKRLAESLGIPLERRGPEEVRILHPTSRPLKLTFHPRTPTQPTREWYLVNEDFEYILELAEGVVNVMERSPRTFSRMGEEELRDILLVILNAHFRGGATGETFNYGGKTDILIRHEGRNVFIGECKIWRGAAEFTRALDQLLGYTTWRDTKAALVVFNRRQNLTKVLRQIPSLLVAHPCYKATKEARGETHFRCIFRHKVDNDREVTLAVLVFDVPTETADGE